MTTRKRLSCCRQRAYSYCLLRMFAADGFSIAEFKQKYLTKLADRVYNVTIGMRISVRLGVNG